MIPKHNIRYAVALGYPDTADPRVIELATEGSQALTMLSKLDGAAGLLETQRVVAPAWSRAKTRRIAPDLMARLARALDAEVSKL